MDTHSSTNSRTEVPFGLRLLKILTNAWSWLFLLFIIVFFEIWSWIVYDRTFFGNLYNVQSVLLTATQILMMALGLTLVIISAGIDLSIGFIAGLAAVTMAVVIRAFPELPALLSFSMGVTAGIAVALIPGVINGWLIAKLKVPSFIGTLGMFGVTRGVAFLVAGGATVSISNSTAKAFGNGKLWEVVPVPVVVAIIVTLFFHYLLKHTRFGLYTYAMGGNIQSAIRAGVNTTKITFFIYLFSAFTAALAGLFYTARFSAGGADAGEPILLNAVAAVFIGGASLSGGSGTIAGTVIGSLIIAIIQFGLVFIGMPPFWQFITVGMVIIIAVLIDQSRDKIARSTLVAFS